MQLIYLPLENLEQRYTVMMNSSLEPRCDLSLYPDHRSSEIPATQFLGIVDTCSFKAKQLALVAQAFADNKIKDGATFLVGDLWFPGVEMIRYMADLQGIDVRLVGFNYAGRSDPTDFVQRLGKWSDDYERAAHKLYDRVLVGSKFHANQVKEFLLHGIDDNTERLEAMSKIVVTGYPWNPDWCVRQLTWREGVNLDEGTVVWPHRPCREKGLDEFFGIASRCPDTPFLVTSCGKIDRATFVNAPPNVSISDNLSKTHYFNTLRMAKHYLSTAHQETFGYTVQEALLFGCICHAPNRACYPEYLDASCLYDSPDEFPKRFEREQEPSTVVASNIDLILSFCQF